MSSYIKYNWPSILWAAFILVICMMPAHHIPHVTIPQFDKIVHTSLYIILGILTFYGWTKQTSFFGLHRKTVIKIAILLSAYGLLIEVMQETLTTDRHFEWMDELADAAGTVIGVLIARAVIKR